MKLPGSWAILVPLAWAAALGPCPRADSAPDAQRVRALVKQLDDRRYAVRHRADRRLRQLGEDVLPLLRQAREARPSLEVCHRLDLIIHVLSANERIRALIEDLDSTYYAIRVKADRQLRNYGKPVIPALRKELAKVKDPGVRVYLVQIITDLSKAK
jgi:hypothetical protein